MEFMDALEEFSGSNDQSIIMKGKRTKRRQRPLSPVGRVAAATSSSSSGGDGGGGGGVLGCVYSSNPSCNTSTNEDEDMANCLILLAQGKSSRKQDEDGHEVIKMEEKFSSRRLNEMVTSTTGGKVGFCVYECKTCNRTFPSFQALGGHRASHKKPKISIEENKSAILFTTSSNDLHHEKDKESQEEESNNKVVLLQSSSSNNKLGKIHECSICGAEFGSGQALGGHMRRHRNYNPSTTTKVAMILESSNSSSHHDDHVEKPRNFFPLDLNLPAPSEDDLLQRDMKFHQFSANQQSHLVF